MSFLGKERYRETLHGQKEVSFARIIIMFILHPDAPSLNGSVMINQSINQSTWSLASIPAIEIGGSGEQMHVHCEPFQWPWRCAGAIWGTLPNAAWPAGLHRKPLDAAIGWLLAPYYPGGRQGDNQQNDDAECTHFAGRFDGHCDAAVGYSMHHPIEEDRGFHKSH
jgi:hypothetical protein